MPAKFTAHTRILMGMPITVKIIGPKPPRSLFDSVYNWFSAVDARFSTYKPNSEISMVNAGLPPEQWSSEMKEVLALCEDTKSQTNGYFDIHHDGMLDPSGLVKGWSIERAAQLLVRRGIENFYIDAGGDIQVRGRNEDGAAWRVGIRHPFRPAELAKVLRLAGNEGVATSGTYVRGPHIYNPKARGSTPQYYASVTIIGSNVYEADRLATAVFAMGPAGDDFVRQHSGIEAYLICTDGTARMTSRLHEYIVS